MTTRRGFFKLLAGAAAMAAVPSIAITSPVPTIWCDGVTCDADGLDALIAGKPVQFSDEGMSKLIGWSGDVLRLPGNFVIKREIKPTGDLRGKTITEGKFELHSSFLDITDATGMSIAQCEIDMRNCPPNTHAIKVRGGSGFSYPGSVFIGVT